MNGAAVTAAGAVVAVAEAAVAPELPDAVMHAVAIVSSRHVRRKGRMIAVPVERYLLGRGPDELFVEDSSSDPPVIGAADGEPWILFLFTSPRGMEVLVAVHDTVVALAPDGTISRAFPPRTPESLADIVLSLRACRYDRGETARALVPKMLAERDADLVLLGLQLAGWGLRNQPVDWADAVRAGGAHALAAVSDEQPLVRRAARELLPAVPPAVALRRLEVLLASVERADVRAELTAAAAALCAGNPTPAGDSDSERLAAAWAAVLERDATLVRAALASADPATQAAGALWTAALVADGAPLPALAPQEAASRLESWLAAWRASPAGLSQQ